MNQTESKVIVALDFSSAMETHEFINRITPGSCRLKVGKELFTREGPQLVRQLVEKGHDVFLDLKFHDIPNTVAKACAAAADLGVWMLNVHAAGGRNMLMAACEAVDKSQSSPLLIAVTVLTSLDQQDLNEVGLMCTPLEQVMRLATLTAECKLDGVVCSPNEVTQLRQQMGSEFCLVTPGIRPAGSDTGDQKRIMTPADAMRNGSSYLVIGRPITQASDPQAVLDSINQDLIQF